LKNQHARMQAPPAQTPLKGTGDSFVFGISGVFSSMSKRDRELRDRERIRQELAREQFEIDPRDGSEAKPVFAKRLASLFRLN
jgi:hypothetical protein